MLSLIHVNAFWLYLTQFNELKILPESAASWWRQWRLRPRRRRWKLQIFWTTSFQPFFVFYNWKSVARKSLEESPKTFASIFCWEKVFLMFSASLNKWKEEFLSFSLSCRMFNFSKKPFSSIELLDPTSNVHFCCSCCFKSIVLDRNIWPWTF